MQNELLKVARIKAGVFLMSTPLFKETQWEVRGLTDVAATLITRKREKEVLG